MEESKICLLNSDFCLLQSDFLPEAQHAVTQDLLPDTFACDPRPISMAGHLWYKVLVNQWDIFSYTAPAGRPC